MKIDNHWLRNADKIPSPNFDLRPVDENISLIVVHCISLPPGEFGTPYIDQLFCNQLKSDDHCYFKEINHLKVSAHVVIKRTGKITQYVAFNHRAWHAGLSEYKGKNRCNDYSIGIELEGDEIQEYTAKQYQKLTELVSSLLINYPNLSAQNIVGHSDIAPGRKTDPGENFKWDNLLLTLDDNKSRF